MTTKEMFEQKFGLTDEQFEAGESPDIFLLELAADHEERICELELFGGVE